MINYIDGDLIIQREHGDQRDPGDWLVFES
jgi:hypothetical protein